jgi:hypothetical protein
MGKRAEKERREAAAAKKRGTSVTANSTSTSTTQSGRSSGANAATASSVKGQKSTRTSAQAKPTTRSTRSSPHASQVTSSGSRVQVVAVSGPNTMDVDHSSEGRPVRSKAAAAVRDLVEQVKTLDGDSDSSSDSDGSGIEIVDEDDIDEADLDTGIEDYEEDEMFSYTDNRWTINETAGSKPKAGKGSAARTVTAPAAKGKVTRVKANQKEVNDEGSESSEFDPDDGNSYSMSFGITMLIFGLSQTFFSSS